eukprot:scaffold57073_cov63-Phaeocystis_antarctica.AAC.2
MTRAPPPPPPGARHCCAAAPAAAWAAAPRPPQAPAPCRTHRSSRARRARPPLSPTCRLHSSSARCAWGAGRKEHVG